MLVVSVPLCLGHVPVVRHFCLHSSVQRHSGARQNAMCRRVVDVPWSELGTPKVSWWLFSWIFWVWYNGWMMIGLGDQWSWLFYLCIWSHIYHHFIIIVLLQMGIFGVFYQPFIWVNFITTSLFSRTLESWLIREIIPMWGLNSSWWNIIIYPDLSSFSGSSWLFSGS